jgi:hypothetical protein
MMPEVTVTEKCHAGTSNVSSKGSDQAHEDQIGQPFVN